jgi:segregation and condensation protein B
MQDQYRRNVIEAALLAAGRPLAVQQLIELFDERERPTAEEVRAALAELDADYAGRGIELREVASGFRIQVRSSMTEVVSRLWQERPTRYSRALLETLALIAYRQPITRAEIEEVRGVTVNPNIVRTLFERNWIRVVGHREVPGRPELLGTTREFLDYFSLSSLDELPTLAALRDMDSLGVQLELPGDGTPAAQSGDGSESPSGGELSAARAEVVYEDEAVDDEEPSTPVSHKPGLVAAPAETDGTDGSPGRY